MMKKVLLTSVLMALACCVSAQAGIVYQAEFTTDGDFEGWVDFQNRGSSAVSGGVLSSVGGKDVQIRSAEGTLNIDVTQYSDLSLEVRIKQTAITDSIKAGVSYISFVGSAANNTAGLPVLNLAATNLSADDTYEVLTWDVKSVIEGMAAGDGILRSLRLDPVEAANGSSSIDYIRFVGTPVPEPATISLLVAGSLVCLGRRK